MMNIAQSKPLVPNFQNSWDVSNDLPAVRDASAVYCMKFVSYRIDITSSERLWVWIVAGTCTGCVSGDEYPSWPLVIAKFYNQWVRLNFSTCGLVLSTRGSYVQKELNTLVQSNMNENKMELYRHFPNPYCALKLLPWLLGWYCVGLRLWVWVELRRLAIQWLAQIAYGRCTCKGR